MKSKKKQQSEFTAIHESGHHVIAFYIGCKLGKISIQPGINESGEYLGLAQTYILGEIKSFHTNMLTAQRVWELIAGRAATEIFCPAINRVGNCQTDFEIIKNLNGFNEIALKMNKWWLDHPAGDMEDFYQTFKSPVIQILQSKQGKRAIKALAGELIKHRYLSGREAARIIEAAWGKPLPPLALPSDKHPPLDVYTPAKSFNDFLYQMSLFANVLKKEILQWIGNDNNTPEQEKIVENLSGAVNHIKLWTQTKE